jgi:hypothetical protein
MTAFQQPARADHVQMESSEHVKMLEENEVERVA